MIQALLNTILSNEQFKNYKTNEKNILDISFDVYHYTKQVIIICFSVFEHQFRRVIDLGISKNYPTLHA